MEFYQLEYFVAIAEYKTVSKASEVLMVSQPAITRAIQRLESEFGCALFDRIKNRLVLNEQGEIALTFANQLLNDRDKMVETLNNYISNRTRIILASISQGPLFGLSDLFKQYYPHLTVNCVVAEDDGRLLDGLMSQEYGAILLNYSINHPDVVSVHFTDEKLYIGVKDNDVFSHAESVTFNDINGTDFLLLSNIGYWGDTCNEKMPDTTFITQDDPRVYDILQINSSLPVFRTNLTIPALQKREHRIYVPVSDQCATLPFYLIYLKKNAASFSFIKDHLNDIRWDLYEHYRQDQ